MKRIIFLLTIFVLASCRSLSERNEECIENMPSEVRGYVREFIQEGENRGKKIALKNLRIELTNRTLTDRGVLCEGYYNQLNHTVSINYFWFKENPRSLLFHELGHAVLNRDHNTDTIKLETKWYYIPKSIMTEDAMTDRFFNAFYVYYMDELFK